MGSGPTLAVAQQLGRSWIGCDANYGAVQTTRRRLQRLDDDEADGPSQCCFSIWKLDSTKGSSSTSCGPLIRVEVQIRRLTGEPSTIEVVVQGETTPALARQMARQRLQSARFGEIAWQEVVDAIEIDPAYDGRCYRPTLVDAPQKRRAQVEGRYELSVGKPAAGAEPSTIAIRITDVLGHEMMIVRSL